MQPLSKGSIIKQANSKMTWLREKTIKQIVAQAIQQKHKLGSIVTQKTKKKKHLILWYFDARIIEVNTIL